MTTSSITPVRRAAACLVLAGAGMGIAGGGVAWASTPVACGTPAHPALYSTTHHDPVPAVTHQVTVIDRVFVPSRAAVPEVSHLELTTTDGDDTPEGQGWSRSGRSWTVEDSAAYTEHEWMRTVVDRAASPGSPAVPAVTHDETVTDEAAWDETVIDSPAVPAVDEVSHTQTVTDKAAWDETVIDSPAVPAVDEVSHTQTVTDKAAWDETVIDSPAVPAVGEVSHYETVVDKAAWDETVIDSPAVPAVGEVSHYETVVDKAAWTETVIDSPAVPAVGEVSHYETVVDKAAWTETVVDGYAFEQKQTGKIRYEDSPTWNAEGGTGARGWSRAARLDRTHVVHHDAVTHQVKVIDTPASPAVPETSHVVHHDAVTHQVKVIDTPASPAVPETSHVVHHDAVTHQVKVIDTPASPAVPETSHVVHHDAVTHQVKVIDTPASPAVPETSHVVHHDAVTHQVKVIDTPASPAVPETSHVVHHDAVTHQVKVIDVPEVLAVEAVEELSHVETGWTGSPDVSPEGEGWTLTGEQLVHEATNHLRHEWMRTVVDAPAVAAVPEVPEVSHTETVVDVPEVSAWDEQVLVSAAIPAGAPCPAHPKVVDAAVLEETAPTAVSTDPAAVPAQTLAQTGTDLAVPLGAGLLFVVVGGGLVAAGRTRRN